MAGTVPPELRNRLGTKVIPKLRTGVGLALAIEGSVEVSGSTAASLGDDLRQILAELGLEGRVSIERR